MEDNVAVLVKNACKSYGSKLILDNLCMKVERGTIYGLLGASGCGKTTLLSCIVGRKKLNSGEVYVLGGQPGTKESGVPGPNVGYMPQDIALVAEFTVRDAVYYFGKIFGMDEETIETRFRSLGKLLDLPPDDRYIKNCSGGQQRRVSFAAALVHQPELLILDEPTVGLDPVLRDSIWNYLVEITEKQNVAVIITTHYIEETRQAHKIGLMRQGTLLAEESPATLLRIFGTDSLEEVFLSLSKQQAEGKLTGIAKGDENNTILPGSVDDLTASTDAIIKPTKKPKSKKNTVGAFSMDGRRLKALFKKNWNQFSRNPSGLSFMVFFPILEILAFFTAIGADVKQIPIGVTNGETNFSTCLDYNKSATAFLGQDRQCEFHNLGCRFLDIIKDPMLSPVYYKDIYEANDAIKHGRIVGTIYISRNFTESFEKKVISSKINDRVLNDSQAMVWLDMSNRQIGATIKYKLIDKVIDFQKEIYKDCNFEVKYGDIPVRFQEDIYGKRDDPFTIFMIPGVLLSIMFFLGTTNTSTIIIADQLEGVWDRSIVAGVSSLEILLTHFVTQFLIIILQTIEVLVLTFMIYGTEFEGEFSVIILLVVLQGLCGMSYGFLISVMSSSHSMANIITTGSFYPMIIICGVIWPIQGMPIGLRVISCCMPFTIPIVSLRNVIKKGWSVMHMEVMNGIGIEILWIFIFCAISLVQLKRKR